MINKRHVLKVIKAIMAMLRTSLPGCDDGPFRQVFKVLLPGEKEEKKRVLSCIFYFLPIHSFSLPRTILYWLCRVAFCRLLTILTKYPLQGNAVLCQLLVISLVQRYQALLRGLAFYSSIVLVWLVDLSKEIMTPCCKPHNRFFCLWFFLLLQLKLSFLPVTRQSAIFYFSTKC